MANKHYYFLCDNYKSTITKHKNKHHPEISFADVSKKLVMASNVQRIAELNAKYDFSCQPKKRSNIIIETELAPPPLSIHKSIQPVEPCQGLGSPPVSPPTPPPPPPPITQESSSSSSDQILLPTSTTSSEPSLTTATIISSISEQFEVSNSAPIPSVTKPRQLDISNFLTSSPCHQDSNITKTPDNKLDIIIEKLDQLELKVNQNFDKNQNIITDTIDNRNKNFDSVENLEGFKKFNITTESISPEYYSVTCESCAKYLLEDNDAKKKKIFSNTLATGIVMSKDKYGCVALGNKNSQATRQTWYNFKKTIIEHLKSQFHNNNQRREVSELEKISRYNKVIGNLIKCCIQMVKTKTSEHFYTSWLSIIESCGADIGDIGHSK